MNNTKNIAVIGSGLAGISAASYLAKYGYKVTVYEKNETYGGRLQQFTSNGFTFDMGPSWYWMPDIFESYFNDFDHTTADYYELNRLNPGYRIYYGKDDYLDIVENIDELKSLFDSVEPNSGESLQHFLDDAKIKYEIAMKHFIYRPSLSFKEYIDPIIISKLGKLNLFKSMSKHIRQYFSNSKLIQMLEFPSLLLGAKPGNTPSMYSLMNYADICLGTWYPKGGIRSIATAMYDNSLDLGVKYRFSCPIDKIHLTNSKKNVNGIESNGEFFETDILLVNGDYQYIEQKLLPSNLSNYSKKYWDKRVFSPSSLIFYIGLNKKIKNIQHHMLFFDTSFNSHAQQIYDKPSWPSDPLFYVSCTSKSDTNTAPENGETLFVLIPTANGLNDSDEIRDKFFNIIIDRIENNIGESIKNNIVFQRSYAHRDFTKDFNTMNGNAYGLANTLMQSAFLKPKMKNKKIGNLYYTGQLTVPGPGMPPSIISGKIAADLISKEHD